MDLVEQKKIRAFQFKRHPWEITRVKILFSVLKYNPSKNFIVDLGSGDAFVAGQLARKFPHAKLSAVDVNYDEQFISDNSKNNLTFFKSIQNLPDSPQIDAMLLMDVLEHVEKPEEIFKEIKSLKNLSPSTQIIITVPAFQFLFSEHDVFLKHFRRYNMKQLTQLLHREGFEIKYTGYFFFALFLARCFQKVLGKKQQHGVHDWRGGNFITTIMIAVLWIDFKICWYLSRIGINLPGLSCYCICHPLPS